MVVNINIQISGALKIIETFQCISYTEFHFFFTFSILTFNTKEYSEEVSFFLKNRGEKCMLESFMMLPLIFERKLTAVK